MQSNNNVEEKDESYEEIEVMPSPEPKKEPKKEPKIELKKEPVKEPEPKPQKLQTKTFEPKTARQDSGHKEQNLTNQDLISIENFDPNDTKARINSPRTLEAWRIEGVLPSELLHIPKSKFSEPGVLKEVANLRYDFNEQKRMELIELVKKTRQKLIEELDVSIYDHPTLAGSTQYQTTDGKFMSIRSAQTSKSARTMMSSGFLGGAMDKDKEKTEKQMEIIRRIKEKEAKRFEKYIINEERKNKILEETEARFEHIRKQEAERNEMIKKSLKEESERKMMEEIQKEKEETQQEKIGKKVAWNNFIRNLEHQKEMEAQAEKEASIKKQTVKEKESKRLEKVKKCEEAIQRQMNLRERKLEEMNQKTQEQMKKMKETQLIKKHESEIKAIEKRMKIQQIMKAKEEKEKEDLARFLEKQQLEAEREMTLKREKAKSLRDIRLQVEEKNLQKERILKQAEDRMQEKINNWLAKQKEADKRLEKLKEHEKFKEILRKEFIILNNQSKFQNKQRFERKNKYQEEKMREKLMMEDIKIETMADQRFQLKDLRKSALNEMERQRQDIKSALYYMTVWNSFNPTVVQKIWNNKAQAKKKATIQGILFLCL